VLVLGIETSCDETAASVVKEKNEVLSNVVLSSINLHKEFGGVIPEIAHRFHSRFIDRVVEKALKQAKVDLKEIDLIAVTYGPGLMGALIVGVSFAKGLSFALKKPLIGINHLHAHLYSALMDKEVEFPFVGLVISGGHTVLVLAYDYDKYDLLGQTQDDAVGEAFDKVARILKLGYPGGPVIDKLTQGTKSRMVEFPRSYLAKDSLDFSFSGLKTAVFYYVKDNYSNRQIPDEDKVSIASGFQEAVVDVLVYKSISACRQNNINRLVIGGGVSRNLRLRGRLIDEAAKEGIEVYFPKNNLCLDNAAMIAGLGTKLYRKGIKSDFYLTPDATLSV